MSPGAVVVTPTSLCQCELPTCLCLVLIQTVAWGPPSSYPPSLRGLAELGEWEWGGGILQVQMAPRPQVWPRRSPLTILNLSGPERDGLQFQTQELLSASGWLEVPSPSTELFIEYSDPSSLACASL